MRKTFETSRVFARGVGVCHALGQILEFHFGSYQAMVCPTFTASHSSNMVSDLVAHAGEL